MKAPTVRFGLICQAGADQHIRDQLGGFLTATELAERDRIVFSAAKEIGIPVVWNLAGGYQTPLTRVLEIHRNTMTACVAEYVGARKSVICGLFK